MSNLVLAFLEYLQKRPGKSKIYDALFILIIFFGLAAAYTVATKYDYIFNTDSVRSEYNDFINAVKNQQRVTEILNSIIKQLGVSRAGVYQFHNGLTGFGRIPFFYYSQTFESVDRGVSQELNNNQRVPISLEPLLSNLADNKCFFVDHIDGTAPIDFVMQSKNTVAYARCPVFDLEGHLVAFVGIEYTGGHTIPPESEILPKLERFSSALSGALILADD